MGAKKITIRKLHAREVLDSRGIPTVEVELTVDDPKHGGECLVAQAIVPSGASTGEGEALELRDGEPSRYGGKGVLQALANIHQKMAPVLERQGFQSLSEVDHRICELDGTSNKSRLGANAILAVSMAFVRAQALAERIPLYQWIAHLMGKSGCTLPVPFMNILNGGRHADNGLDIQEFMIIPVGFTKFSEALRAGSEVFQCLKKILKSEGLSTGVGDEGGFAPKFQGAHPHEQALQVILRAIQAAGYQAGREIFLGLDVAASEFFDGERRYRFEDKLWTSDEMIHLYSQWSAKYPILSIEDGLSEKDWMGWSKLTQTMSSRCQLVGDDLFVTQSAYLKKGIQEKAANAILIKLNQVGTVTETLETMKIAAGAGYQSMVSHRSGETEDTFIADLAVGSDCGQIKAGSLSRTDRLAKYNQLLRIEEELGTAGKFAKI